MSVTEVLQQVVAALPGGGEVREGQVEMAEAVARTLSSRGHLVVQAGTGTGKSLAYLVPAVLSGHRVVVATATKALQDQLAGKDLPFVADHVDVPFEFAVLKGRSNYVCRQRVAELTRKADHDADHQLTLDVLAERAPAEEVARLIEWAGETEIGDRAELEWEPSPAAWGAVSVGSKECPGSNRCPQGEACFAEAARRRAAAAQVVVVNLHLYGLDVEAGGVILPEHDLVVVDEAHQLEDIVSTTNGLEIGAGRFPAAARAVASVLEDPKLVDDVAGAGPIWAAALAPLVGRRQRSALPEAVGDAVTLAMGRLDRAQAALRAVSPPSGSDAATRRHRAQKQLGALTDELALVVDAPDTHVAWVEGPDHNPSWRMAPIDVADLLAGERWSRVGAVLTSATIPPGLADRVGLPEVHRELDVGSPFDYEAHALLYCAAHLPEPRSAEFEEASHDELSALIRAAGGRTLALFTSWRAMEAALEALRERLPFRLLGQRDLPKPALVEAFAAEPETCLFATMGFWQGIDVPGPTLSLVTIDKLPFPRPDEPLLQARRERARETAFRTIDLPRAVTLLAQGAGRLIRSAEDRGVVAVLDPRLAKNAGYRWDLINALPPMRRTRDRAEVEAFLEELRAPD
ncbi:MAG TPA: ATP-dependent DNA helicase [Acidimicrobiales bacterium]|nr:ATP-dependent DNA helicase [Acidimicrobiales bacterium]